MEINTTLYLSLPSLFQMKIKCMKKKSSEYNMFVNEPAVAYRKLQLGLRTDSATHTTHSYHVMLYAARFGQNISTSA